MRKNSASSFAQFSMTVVAALAVFSVSPAHAQHTSGASNPYRGEISFGAVKNPTNKNYISNGKGVGQKICQSIPNLSKFLSDFSKLDQNIAAKIAQLFFGEYLSNAHGGGSPAISNVHSGPPAAEENPIRAANVHSGPPAKENLVRVANVRTASPALALDSEYASDTRAGQLLTYIFKPVAGTAKNSKIVVQQLGGQTTVSVGGGKIVMKGNQIIACN